MLTFINPKYGNTTVKIKHINDSVVDLEVCDWELILMKEASINNFVSPNFEQVRGDHDLEVGVMAVVLVDRIGKVWSEDVTYSVFFMNVHFSSGDCSESNVDIIFNLLLKFLLSSYVVVQEYIFYSECDLLYAV